MSVTKTYKLHDDTEAKLQVLLEELKKTDPSATWETCFDAMIRAYIGQNAAQAAGRAEEAADFHGLLTRIEESYNALLAGIVNTKERAEAQAQSEIDAIKKKLEAAEAESEAARETKTENETLKKEIENARKRAEEAEAERDETRVINKRLMSELEKAEAELGGIEDIKKKAASIEALQEENKIKGNQIEAYEKKLQDAEAEYKELVSELKERYDEKLETAKAAAANNAQAARLEEREKLMKEMDAMRADFALKLAEVAAVTMPKQKKEK